MSGGRGGNRSGIVDYEVRSVCEAIREWIGASRDVPGGCRTSALNPLCSAHGQQNISCRLFNYNETYEVQQEEYRIVGLRRGNQQRPSSAWQQVPSRRKPGPEPAGTGAQSKPLCLCMRCSSCLRLRGASSTRAVVTGRSCTDWRHKTQERMLGTQGRIVTPTTRDVSRGWILGSGIRWVELEAL